MAERAYTVAEMDALRRAIENKWLYGRYNPQTLGNNFMSRSYREPDKTRCVEELVRTHMIAGHTAQDLYESEASAVNSGAPQ